MKKNNKNTQIKGRKIGQIMGINVTGTTTTSLLTRVEKLISCNNKFYIVTPNPELVLMAQRNKELKTALNAADFAIPDAIGLSQAAKYLSLNLPKEKILRFIIGFFQGLRVGAATFFDRDWLTEQIKPVKGRVLFLDLVKLADKNGWKVFLLGGLDDEAEIASRNLQLISNNLQIKYHKGPKLNNDAEPASEIDRKLQYDAIDQINKFKPQLLFVAFGNPKQEIWINKNLSKLNIGGAMAVGGTLRYVAGMSKLPPKWMAGVGLEWVWRLITEPRRIGRIWNAVIVFPFRVFLSKFN